MPASLDDETPQQQETAARRSGVRKADGSASTAQCVRGANGITHVSQIEAHHNSFAQLIQTDGALHFAALAQDFIRRDGGAQTLVERCVEVTEANVFPAKRWNPRWSAVIARCS